jgi:FPC/CPF motif-containing protein YcgG
MRRWNLVLLVVLVFTIPAVGASTKQKGTGSLKDFQPAGTTDKKHKNQQFDFTFVASGMQYTCRTPEKSKLKATDFPVGSDINYQVNQNKGEVKNMSGKGSKCTIVRVEKLPDNASAPQ